MRSAPGRALRMRVAAKRARDARSDPLHLLVAAVEVDVRGVVAATVLRHLDLHAAAPATKALALLRAADALVHHRFAAARLGHLLGHGAHDRLLSGRMWRRENGQQM